MISAGYQLILFAIAFNNASCSFIIPSPSVAEYYWALSTPQRLNPSKISDRTDQILASLFTSLALTSLRRQAYNPDAVETSQLGPVHNL